MKGECIFKVDGGKGIYRVCQRTTRGGYIMFAVMKGRRLGLPVSVFKTAGAAITAATDAAHKDCKEIYELIYTL